MFVETAAVNTRNFKRVTVTMEKEIVGISKGVGVSFLDHTYYYRKSDSATLGRIVGSDLEEVGALLLCRTFLERVENQRVVFSRSTLCSV